MTSAPQYPVESVANALRILMMLGTEHDLRSSEVARRLGVAPSTGHRLLSMLQYFELAEQDERTKGYSAGPALLELSLQVIDTANLSGRARRLLDDLADRAEETVSLGILRGAEALVVNSVESPRAVRVGSLVGARYPAHLAAIGRALLAELPMSRLEELYPPAKGQSLSIPRASDLVAELESVREHGYALNVGETGDEVGAIAVPVRDQASWAHTALALSMPLSRFRKSRIPELLPLLNQTARALGVHAR